MRSLREIETVLRALADELREHAATLDPDDGNEVERQHRWIAGIAQRVQDLPDEIEEYRKAYRLEPLASWMARAGERVRETSHAA